MVTQAREDRRRLNMSVIGLILVAALTRLLPHPPNVTPITAIALFGGTHLSFGQASFVTLGSMVVSDIALGILKGDWSWTLHSTLPVVYGSLLATIWLAQRYLRGRIWIGRLAGITLAASLLFFLVTNFAVWLLWDLYPKTWEGFIACYVAALPFFRNSLFGDCVYTGTLFGLHALWTRLQEAGLRVSKQRRKV